jgi:antitoxin VapB
MSIVIDDPETEQLACALAERTGERVEAVVRRILRAELESDAAKPGVCRVEEHPASSHRERYEAAQRLVDEFRKLPVLDDRPMGEILGYDENGLPR